MKIHRNETYANIGLKTGKHTVNQKARAEYWARVREGEARFGRRLKLATQCLLWGAAAAFAWEAWKGVPVLMRLIGG